MGVMPWVLWTLNLLDSISPFVVAFLSRLLALALQQPHSFCHSRLDLNPSGIVSPLPFKARVSLSSICLLVGFIKLADAPRLTGLAKGVDIKAGHTAGVAPFTEGNALPPA